ncbi:MAG: hypothetical protein Q8L27_03270 [archaeon]|nr:hypothetical protein [archaeon]
MKTLASIVLGLGLLVNSGCRAFFVDQGNSNNSPLRANHEFRIAYEPKISKYDLNESKSIPVHPDDASFLHGDTEIKAKGRDFLYGFNANIGIAERLETPYLIFKLGGDLELSLDKQNICHEYKQQISDTRDPGISSFVYDRIDPELLSVTPFMGVKAKLGDFEPYMEYGIPIKKFTREWGHYRWAKESSIGKESDSVTGRKFSVGLIYEGELLNEPRGLGLEFSKEDYSTKFGDIENSSILFNIQKTF